jgi:chaperonin GroES
MKFRPLHDRVVIERIDAEAKTAGGVIIPDTAKEKPQQGKVIAVGPGGRDEGGRRIPIDVKVGERILFGKWSGVLRSAIDQAIHATLGHHEEPPMQTSRFGRKLKLPATIAIKHQVRQLMFEEAVKTAEAEARAEAIRAQLREETQPHMHSS